MMLSSLYDVYCRKLKTTEDNNLRKRLLALPEIHIFEMRGTTLLVENASSGLQVLDFDSIEGLTHTTAINTLAIPKEVNPVTVAKYFENKGKKLDHPELPLLAIRKEKRFDAKVHFDFLPLERVYCRDVSSGQQSRANCSPAVSTDEDFEELIIRFVEMPPLEAKSPPASKSNSLFHQTLEPPKEWRTPQESRFRPL